MRKDIDDYFECMQSEYIDIATVLDPEDCTIYLMLAPEYTIETGDEVYDEGGFCYKVVHYCSEVSKEDVIMFIASDLCTEPVRIAKGKIYRKDFK